MAAGEWENRKSCGETNFVHIFIANVHFKQKSDVSAAKNYLNNTTPPSPKKKIPPPKKNQSSPESNPAFPSGRVLAFAKMLQTRRWKEKLGSKILTCTNLYSKHVREKFYFSNSSLDLEKAR